MSESIQNLDSVDPISQCEPEPEPDLPVKEDQEEEEVEDDEEAEDDEGEPRLTKPWPICGIPEEREMSPDDEDQTGLPTEDGLTSLINDRDMMIERESGLTTMEGDLETEPEASKVEIINLQTDNILSRNEGVKQEFNNTCQPDHSNQLNLLESDLTSINDPQIKPEQNESELFDDSISTTNPFNKLHSPRHIDSSTVAIPPAFQTLSGHIPFNFFATRSHPWNRSGFRYLACGPARSDEPNDSPGMNDRYPVYHAIETVPQGQVKWAWEDRSNYVYITKDGLAVTTDRGFRSARANLPIRQGRFYFEIILDRAGGEANPGSRSEPEHAHVRIGLARRESGLNAPVGIDGYSYGIRDKTGEKVHLSKLEPYGEAFKSGDVIGVYVDLPPMRSPDPDDPHDPARIERRRIPIRYRRQLYFESPEYPISKEMEDLADAASPSKLKPKPQFRSTLPPPPAVKKPVPGQKPIAAPIPTSQVEPTGIVQRELPVLKGSKLAFFRNGVCQGVAFQDLLDFLPLRAHTTSSQDKLNSNLVTNLTESTSLEPLTANRENLHDDGTMGYYPCVSVYGGGIARLNPGPDFKYPPPEDIEACLHRVNSTKAVTPSDPSNQIDGSTTTSTSSKWQALSELYPVYLAEQNQLDRLDAIEYQRRVKEEMKLVEMANETKARKRRRVPSPSSRPVSPTSSSSQSVTTVTKGPKAKKKAKISNLSHLNVVTSDGSKSQTFKPSPLGVMEMYDESLRTTEPEVGLNETRVDSFNVEMSTTALVGDSPPAIREDFDDEMTQLAPVAHHNSNPDVAPLPPSTIETSTVESSTSKLDLEDQIEIEPSVSEPVESESHQKLESGISNEQSIVTEILPRSPQASLQPCVIHIPTIISPDMPPGTVEVGNIALVDQTVEQTTSMIVEQEVKLPDSPLGSLPQVLPLLEKPEPDSNSNPSDVPLVDQTDEQSTSMNIEEEVKIPNSSMICLQTSNGLEDPKSVPLIEESDVLSSLDVEIQIENHVDPSLCSPTIPKSNS
ncbi:uncharacterized protein MELLADRAFT_94127 [Melampsora larici-populina 98AG31]|uniref:B30.2/SPRY domain-containing protein n=1 Tax=Melampsora larici-populina (strain 98AG31 / pathotype 3-4-7) TaxID=747676 RepID=F4S6K3_MELLP|nr:uncharacterized protein MELLADRAFT_94127 [Melampsora larici-populina 98AG31]EGF99743.1 hypothetical protein MELLADRAFT_94127 [Melampsora larici-populina 98AG31]